MISAAKTLKETLQQAVLLLRKAGCDSPRLDAEVLWMHVSGQAKHTMIVDAYEPVSNSYQDAYTRCINRRCKREPIVYIVEKKEFWSRSFKVNSDVLIPRPETEHLIEWMLEHYSQRDYAWRFADVGTGSGCVAITLACEYPKARILACDISAAAIDVARHNAVCHGVENRIDFMVADLLSPCVSKPIFDAIVSNPPYVSEQEMHYLAPELGYEPAIALTDHADGLQCARKLLDESVFLLKNNGLLCLETGPCGYIKEPLPPLFLRSIYHDLAGHLRGVVYQLR